MKKELDVHFYSALMLAASKLPFPDAAKQRIVQNPAELCKYLLELMTTKERLVTQGSHELVWNAGDPEAYLRDNQKVLLQAEIRQAGILGRWNPELQPTLHSLWRVDVRGGVTLEELSGTLRDYNYFRTPAVLVPYLAALVSDVLDDQADTFKIRTQRNAAFVLEQDETRSCVHVSWSEAVKEVVLDLMPISANVMLRDGTCIFMPQALCGTLCSRT